MTTPILSAVLESVDLKEQCTLCTPLPPHAKMGKNEEKTPPNFTCQVNNSKAVTEHVSG